MSDDHVQSNSNDWFLPPGVLPGSSRGLPGPGIEPNNVTERGRPSRSPSNNASPSDENDTRPRTPLDYFDFNTLRPSTQSQTHFTLNPNQNFRYPILRPTSPSFSNFPPSNMAIPGSPYLTAPHGTQHRQSFSSQTPSSHEHAGSDPWVVGPRSDLPLRLTGHQQTLQQTPFTFNPFYASSHVQNPIPPQFRPTPTIVVERATPHLAHAVIPPRRYGHQRSRSATTQPAQPSNLLNPLEPFIPRTRSSSTSPFAQPQSGRQRQHSAPAVPQHSGMALQQRLPSAEGGSLAPGISFTPEELDRFRSRRSGQVVQASEAGANKQASEANLRALGEMEEAHREREAKRAEFEAKTNEICEEKRLLQQQLRKPYSEDDRLAVAKLKSRIKASRDALKRFNAKWREADAELAEYQRKYGGSGQS